MSTDASWLVGSAQGDDTSRLPMPLSILLMLLLLALLLVASGFFSGSETALFSLSRHQRARCAQSNALVPRTILTLLAETRGLLITLLLGNMTINVLYFVVSSVLLIKVSEMDRVGGGVMAGLTVVPLLAIILLGEVMPKLVASRLPDRFARVIALPMLAVHRVLSPIRVSSSVLVITPLSRLLAPPVPSPDLSPEELDAMLDHLGGVLDEAGYFYPPDKKKILERNIRTMFTHAKLTVAEVRLFRGMVRQFAWWGRGGKASDSGE